MIKTLVLLCCLSLMCFITACESQASGNIALQEGAGYEKTPSTASASQAALKSTPPTSKVEVDMDKNIYEIQIGVGNQTFSAILYKNETTDAIMDMLPMTLDMGDLNKNEKYYYLPDSLPTNTEKPSGIQSGNLMLYGTDCLVLFYESFSSSYSYTRLGHLEDANGLADALGSGNVLISFSAK